MKKLNTAFLSVLLALLAVALLTSQQSLHLLGGWILVLCSSETLSYLSQLTQLIDWCSGKFSKKPKQVVGNKAIAWETENVREETIRCTEDRCGHHREIVFSITTVERRNFI